MTPRKKKGLGFLITGGIFGLFGGIYMVADADPNWLSYIPVFIGFLATTFGFSVVFWPFPCQGIPTSSYS